MKMYELASDYRELMDKLEAGELPEELLADTLEGIRGALEEKADGIACMLKALEADAAALRAEEDKLSERRRSKERTYDRMKAYLSDMLLHAGVTKVETPRSQIRFRRSEAVEIDHEADFIRWAEENRDDFLNYKEPSINKTAVKKALLAGEEIAGARLEARQNLQVR